MVTAVQAGSRGVVSAKRQTNHPGLAVVVVRGIVPAPQRPIGRAVVVVPTGICWTTTTKGS